MDNWSGYVKITVTALDTFEDSEIVSTEIERTMLMPSVDAERTPVANSTTTY